MEENLPVQFPPPIEGSVEKLGLLRSQIEAAFPSERSDLLEKEFTQFLLDKGYLSADIEHLLSVMQGDKRSAIINFLVTMLLFD